MTMAWVVLQLKLKGWTAAVKKDADVALQSSVPEALFRNTFAFGEITELANRARSQRLKLTVELAGTEPEVLGTPACVSNAAMVYSPGAVTGNETRATPAASGPAVFSWNCPAVLEAS